ncbi:MAG: protein kinase [Anaerolineae bacterium]|nr:protein kinase [Anaerolineae bacterium]
MAIVYKAFQPSLRRYVALKVLPDYFQADPEFVARFQREARAAAQLSHPNVVTIYDVGEQAGIHYIAMEYLEGGSLLDRLARGPLSPEEALQIVEQVGGALDFAHSRGLIHRDIKPGNILFSADGRPKVTDFGIARAGDTSRLTRSGTLLGTPEYMSPEQAQGRPVDHRSDLYALGVILYEMLTGRVPFQADTPHAIVYALIHQPPLPPRQLRPDLSSAMEAVLLKALAKQPNERFQTGADMTAALWTATEPSSSYGGEGGLGERAPTLDEADRMRRRPPAVVPPPSRGKAKVDVAPAPARGKGQPLVWLLVGVVAVLAVVLAVLLALAISGRLKEEPIAALTLVTTSEPPASPVSTRPIITQVITSSPTEGGGMPTEQLPTTEIAIPTVEPSETPVPPSDTPTPTPSATATNTATPTKMPSTPTKLPGVLYGFERFGTWKRGDQPNGSFVQSAAQVHKGSYSGQLDYHFDTNGNDFVVFVQACPLAGQPTRITAWIYGDGAGHFFNVWIKDQAGQVWQVPLGRISHTGWQQMVGALDVNQPWPWAHISGPDNGVIDYPVSFYALTLDDGVDTFIGSGTIYVDEMRYEE